MSRRRWSRCAGASCRRYLRVVTPVGTAVAMFAPSAGGDGVAIGAAPPRWAFLEVHALLRERGVRVPALLGEDCEHGLLLLEDLGTRRSRPS